MKFRPYFPFLALVMLVLTVGLTCATPTLVTPTAIPQPPTQPPALPPPPTQAPTFPPRPITAPTQTQLPPIPQVPQSGDLIYSTTFDDLSDWQILTKDDLSNYVIENRDYGLFITLPSKNDYAYFYYNLGSADVRMEADVELVGGTNYTYIYLVCRSSDKGEYMFILDTGGLWQISKWDATNSDYTRLKEGGSVNINVAKAKNHMTGICKGNTLTFKINGATLGTATDYMLSDGEIGIEVTTFDYPHSETVIHELAVYAP
jgi:hypothetical protein